MRQTIATIIFAFCGMTAASASTDNAGVSNVSIERNGNYLSVDMTMDLSGLSVGRNSAVLLTPRLTNGTDSIDLVSVGVYGRRRYYHYKRNNGDAMISGTDEMSYRVSKVPSPLEYHQVVPYKEWMNGSVLTVHEEDYGCCNSIKGESDMAAGEYFMFTPDFLYVKPEAASKTRSIEATAYVSFPVNKAEIRPGYLNNNEELGKIQATIDSVKNDADYTITSISLKGYASPEGSYTHNSELAKGRTEALSDYVREQYSFGDGVITTGYEAEDWDGLRSYVEKSSLEHRTEILAIIDDGSLNPDEKESKIKETYPAEYRNLLSDCYPSLRHTDYTVSYEVRRYSDIDEIRQVYKEHPRDLSLDEIYDLSQEYEPDSDEFIELFETAVRLYPNDATANLNAANTAMSRGDLTAASRYLEKAGDSGEAEYARGILAYMQGDMAAATEHLRNAENAGIKKATEMIKTCKL